MKGNAGLLIVAALVVVLALMLGSRQSASIVAPAYTSAATYSDVMDTSYSGECSSTGEGTRGIIITNTPSDVTLNRQRSYIQMSGGDSGRYGGDRIEWDYAQSYPDVFCASFVGTGASNCYNQASIVKTDPSFRIPQGGISCTYGFHLEFDRPITTTTTITYPSQQGSQVTPTTIPASPVQPVGSRIPVISDIIDQITIILSKLGHLVGL